MAHNNHGVQDNPTWLVKREDDGVHFIMGVLCLTRDSMILAWDCPDKANPPDQETAEALVRYLSYMGKDVPPTVYDKIPGGKPPPVRRRKFYSRMPIFESKQFSTAYETARDQYYGHTGYGSLCDRITMAVDRGIGNIGGWPFAGVIPALPDPAELQDQLAAMTAQRDNAQNAVQRAQTRSARLKAQRDQARAEVTSEQARRLQLENTTAGVNLTDLQTQNADLRRRVANRDNDLRRREQELNTATAAAATAEKELKTARDTLANHKNAAAQLHEMKKRDMDKIDKLANENESLLDEKTKLEAAVKTLQETNLAKENVSLLDEKKELESTVKTLLEQVEHLQEKLTEVQTDNAGWVDERKSWKRVVDNLKKESEYYAKLAKEEQAKNKRLQDQIKAHVITPSVAQQRNAPGSTASGNLVEVQRRIFGEPGTGTAGNDTNGITDTVNAKRQHRNHRKRQRRNRWGWRG